MRFKLHILVILALLMAFPVNRTTQAESGVTLHFVRGARTPESDPPALWDDTGDLISAWNKLNPDIKIVVDSVPFNDLDTKQLTALKAGSAESDVLLINHVTVGAAIGTGGLEPLDSCIASDKTMDPKDWIPGLYAVGTAGGKQYTVPFDTDTRVMYYNKEALTKAGINKAPETWDELYAAMDALKAKGGGIFPAYFPGTNKWYVLYHSIGVWLVENQSSFLTADGKASATLEPGTVAAFKHAVRLAKYAPEGALASDGSDMDQLFAQGKIGFVFTGVWMEPTIKQVTNGAWKFGQQYDAVLIPGPTKGKSGSTNGGFQLGISKASKNKDAACKFVAWLTSPEILAQATKDHIPTRVSAQETKFFKDYAGDNPATLISLKQSVFGAPPVSTVPELPEIADIVLQGFNRAVAGQVSEDDALKQIDEDIKALLAKR